jgi:NADPH-dependent 2,4-dienoyl-CoA reductase/sulfur reductase-like enzyme
MSDLFDVVVVGSGPGGIAAATVAAEAGKRVCLLDDNATPGGQIWRGGDVQTEWKPRQGKEFQGWMTRLRSSGCTVLQGWKAIDRPGPNLLRLERNQEGRDVTFGALIVATGARERFLPFPGWTLPGVMGAGGLQALLKAGLDPRGKRVVVAGTGPLLLAVAAGVAEKGGSVVGTYEQAPLMRLANFGLTLLKHPQKLVEGARYRIKTLGSPFRTGSWVVRAEGQEKVESVTLTDGRKQWTVACDWLACGFHLVPNLELPRLLGCRIRGGYVDVDRFQQSSVQGVACVGELTGVGGLDKTLLEGQIAGWASVGRPMEARALASKRPRLEQFALGLDRAFALRPELRALAEAETVVCRCEDVTHAELEGRSCSREAKLHTRCGMGACQGRVCGSAVEFLYGWENTSSRPPVFPSTVATLAAEVPAPYQRGR